MLIGDDHKHVQNMAHYQIVLFDSLWNFDWTLICEWIWKKGPLCAKWNFQYARIFLPRSYL